MKKSTAEEQTAQELIEGGFGMEEGGDSDWEDQES
jgi:hypothetical protein